MRPTFDDESGSAVAASSRWTLIAHQPASSVSGSHDQIEVSARYQALLDLDAAEGGQLIRGRRFELSLAEQSRGTRETCLTVDLAKGGH